MFPAIFPSVSEDNKYFKGLFPPFVLLTLFSHFVLLHIFLLILIFFLLKSSLLPSSTSLWPIHFPTWQSSPNFISPNFVAKSSTIFLVLYLFTHLLRV